MRDYLTLRVTDLRQGMTDGLEEESRRSLLVTVEATHAGIINGNMRFYRPDRMQEAVHTWTSDYPKPVLLRHDEKSDPVGRVVRARYVDFSWKYAQKYPELKNLIFYDSSSRRMDLFKSVGWIVDVLSKEEGYAGLGAIELGLNITEPEAIEKVLRGEYLTVSVGFKTDSAICSVCHTDWAVDDRCEHRLGRRYEDKLAFLIAGRLEYEEVSWVNFPADPFARVKSKEEVRHAVDTLQNRVFFLGLPAGERARIACADELDLPVEDDISVAIEPVEISGETKMEELRALMQEVRSQDLTLERAREIRDQLEKACPESPAEKRYVTRILNVLDAVARERGWESSSSSLPTREEVEAQLAGANEKLAGLKGDERAEFIRQMEELAAAYGINWKPASDEEEECLPCRKKRDQENSPEEETEDWPIGDLPEEDQALFADPDAIYEEMAADLGDAKLTAAQRKKLPKSAFCGPGRSFPVPDCAHVIAARRLIGRSKYAESTKQKILACVNRKAKRLGCDKSDKDTVAAELFSYLVCHLKDASSETAQAIISAMEAIEQAFSKADEETQGVILQALMGLVEKLRSSGNFEYYKRVLTGEQPAEEPVDPEEADRLKKEIASLEDEIGLLTKSLEDLKSRIQGLEKDKQDLLEANRVLVNDHKRTLATALVLIRNLALGQRLSADEIRQQVDRRMSRHLVSLKDAFADLVEEFPGLIDQMASTVAREVDDGTAVDLASDAPEAPSEPRRDGESEDDRILRVLDWRERLKLQARRRYQELIEQLKSKD